jgi:hypothetical protein
MKLFYLLLISTIPGESADKTYSPEPMSWEVCIAEGKEWKARRSTYDYQCVGPIERSN